MVDRPQTETPPSSVLQNINQKELELRRSVEQAEQQAEILLQATRAEAKKSLAQAEQAARAEADALYQRGLEQARQEAAALIKTADQQAMALRRQTTTRLHRAAQQIVALVLSHSLAEADWHRETSTALMKRE